MPDRVLPLPAQQAKDLFRSIFSGDPALVAWAPGRVNLIGEHTDYNDGWVLPVASDRCTALAVRLRPDRTVQLYSAYHREACSFSLDTDQSLAGGDLSRWALYPLGICRQFVLAGYAIKGFDAVIRGDVPLGGGMSSSAALEVATAQALMALHQIALEPLTVARLCQRAEHETVGVQCGIMDQATACLGRAGHAIQLDCRSLAYDYIPFNLPDTALIVCDSGVRHDLATSAYNERRHQCAEATVLLAQAAGRKDQIVALRDVTAQEFEQYGSVLPPILRRRARHVISENSRVHAAAAALRAGDVRQLGDLMNASHISLRDDYEVSSPELDALVAIATTLPGVWGARMMGAGFGGSIVALVSQEAIPALSATIAQEYPARTGHQATLYTVQVGGGPGIDGPA